MFKKYFSAGLLLWLPLAITLWLLESLMHWSDILIALLPERYQPQNLFGFNIPGLGIAIAIALIFVTGILVANFLGQKVLSLWEDLLNHIPLVRSVYSGVKQITSTVLSGQSESFKEVVLVEFPQKGQWTYGFVVSKPDEQAAAVIGGEQCVTLFVPTAPNPTSGFVVMVDRASIVPANVSVEDALKYHLTLGVMAPPIKEKSVGNNA